MASPQTENGHIRIARELWEAIMKAGFTARERSVIDAFIRESYGWQRKEAKFSASLVTFWTDMDRCNARKTMAALLTKNVLICVSESVGSAQGTYMLNKDYTSWKGCSISLNKSKTYAVSGVKSTPQESEADSSSEELLGSNQPQQTPVTGVKSTPPDLGGWGQNDPVCGVEMTPFVGSNQPHIIENRKYKGLALISYVARLEKLQGNILPRDALEKIEQWQDQAPRPELLEAWLEDGLVHVEKRAAQGAKFKQPWKIVLAEAEAAREADRHDTMGLPGEIWGHHKVYRNGSGIPCLVTGLPLTGHPDHPSQQKKARTPNEH